MYTTMECLRTMDDGSFKSALMEDVMIDSGSQVNIIREEYVVALEEKTWKKLPRSQSGIKVSGVNKQTLKCKDEVMVKFTHGDKSCTASRGQEW
jgi:hypothetical protein